MQILQFKWVKTIFSKLEKDSDFFMSGHYPTVGKLDSKNVDWLFLMTKSDYYPLTFTMIFDYWKNGLQLFYFINSKRLLLKQVITIYLI